MQTALYLRVSTAHQRPDLQDDGLRAYAARAGLEIMATYVEHAVSGRQERHPQLQALMRAARQHAFACVLVWKFDRFARSVAYLLRALEEFDYLRIRFISVQDQVDTASPMGSDVHDHWRHGGTGIRVHLRAGQGWHGGGASPWEIPGTPRHSCPAGGPDRRVGGHNLLEYSPDSRRLSRLCKPFGGGYDRQACPSPSASRVPVTPFYTYPDHTPDSDALGDREPRALGVGCCYGRR